MKTAIVGSRSLKDPALLEEALKGLHISKIITGGAEGIDTLAEAWAKQHSIPVQIIKPDWMKHGKAAGVLRNQQIIEAAELVIAIWDGKSSGTADSIRRAKALNRLLKIIVIDSEPKKQMSLF